MYDKNIDTIINIHIYIYPPTNLDAIVYCNQSCFDSHVEDPEGIPRPLGQV